MSLRTAPELRRLALHNPVPHPVDDFHLDERAVNDLSSILRSRVPLDRRPSRLRLAVPAVAALTLAVGTVVALPAVLPSAGTSSSAFAATPAPLAYQSLPGRGDARQLLLGIADRVAAQPDDIGDGPYARVAMQSWNLFTAVSGERTTSVVVPVRTETWTAPDGSGRAVTEEDKRGGFSQDRKAGPGDLALMWPLRSLSADDSELARQLEQGHPVQNGPAERLVAIEDAYQQMPLAPSVRAAVLRYLAATPTLAVTGAVTDRAGRTGVAVSVESDYSGLPTRYTLIIDATTGRVLSAEDTLTTSAGALNVSSPAVVSYTAFLSAEYSSNTG